MSQVSLSIFKSRIFSLISYSLCLAAIAAVYWQGQTNPPPQGMWPDFEKQLLGKAQGTLEPRLVNLPCISLPPNNNHRVACALYFSPEKSKTHQNMTHVFMVLSQDGRIGGVDELDLPDCLESQARAGQLTVANFKDHLRDALTRYCLGKKRSAIRDYLSNLPLNRRYSSRTGLYRKGIDLDTHLSNIDKVPGCTSYLLNLDEVVLDCGNHVMTTLNFDAKDICASTSESADGFIIWMGGD